jgi:hypothetical protein
MSEDAGIRERLERIENAQIQSAKKAERYSKWERTRNGLLWLLLLTSAVNTGAEIAEYRRVNRLLEGQTAIDQKLKEKPRQPLIDRLEVQHGRVGATREILQDNLDDVPNLAAFEKTVLNGAEEAIDIARQTPEPPKVDGKEDPDFLIMKESIKRLEGLVVAWKADDERRKRQRAERLLGIAGQTQSGIEALLKIHRILTANIRPANDPKATINC